MEFLCKQPKKEEEEEEDRHADVCFSGGVLRHSFHQFLEQIKMADAFE